MFKDHFSERAQAYAACRPGYPPELAAWLGSVAPARTRAWEAGCGSGQMSVLLAEHFAEVAATDASAAQLAHARPHARVSYSVGLAESCALADASADAAVAAQAAHWFDLPAYFAEVRRVVRPGGIVALIGYGNAIIDDDAIQARFLRFYEEEVGAWWPRERRMIEDGYTSIDFPFEAIEPPALDMRQVWTADQMLGYVHTWSAVRAYERERGGDAFAAFAGELRALWGDGSRK